MWALTVVAAVSFALAFALTPLARAVAHRVGVVDKPNHRSSHVRPTARAGGVAILVAALIASASFAPRPAAGAAVLAGAVAIAIVGLLDDVRGLRASVRLAVHVAAAVCAAAAGGLVVRSLGLPGTGEWALSVAAVPLTVFWIVGMTNAYNFMDGINGIASLQAIAAGGGLAAIFLQHGDSGSAAVAAALAAAAAGFLPWNFPRASIFMGDVASGTLGFLFAALVVKAVQDGASLIATSLVLLPFYADAGVTLVRRLARGERVYEAHRSHFYQRLNQLGWSHARVSSLWFALAVCSSAVAVLYPRLSTSGRVGCVMLLAVLVVGVAVGVTTAERRRVDSAH